MQYFSAQTTSKKSSKRLKEFLNKIDEIKNGVKKSNAGANFLNATWGMYIKLNHKQKQALNFEQICKLTLNKFLGHE